MSTMVNSNAAAVPPEQKYVIEAAKRKRTDGTKQFEQLHFSNDNRLRSLVDDCWADHAALDKLPIPVKDGGHVKFFITGAGMGGIMMAIKLIKNGYSADQILLVERAGGVGGTWYWNRYPGLHCDVESYCYLPLLEETGYVPKQKYCPGVDIRTYLNDLVKRSGQDMEGRTDNGVWTQWEEEKKLSVHANFVTLAGGVYPYPQVPRVPGLSDFQGPMFHTSRWNYIITGGSSNETFPVMDKLKGRRIGIIGTGATTIQMLPLLAKYAKEVYVFQRTPSHVHIRSQHDTDPAEWREKIASKPGWQKERMENFAEKLAGHEVSKYLVNDKWSELNAYSAIVGSKRFGVVTPDKAHEHIENMLALDSEHNRQARERISQIVKDKRTAEQLTPWYPTWCKRPTFSDTYLEIFNDSHVHLIDTDGRGIDCITTSGVVTNSQEYPIDILILSTGYRTPASTRDTGSLIGIDIVGRNGQKMSKKWEEQGISTLHGVCSNGFPNLFFQSAAQAAATANYSHFIDVVSEHIAGIIKQAHQNTSAGSQTSVIIEPTVEAEDAWGTRIASDAAFFSPAMICTPGYLNSEGEAFLMPDEDDEVAMMQKRKAAIWAGGLVEFSRMMERWRGEGQLEGLMVSVEG